MELLTDREEDFKYEPLSATDAVKIARAQLRLLVLRDRLGIRVSQEDFLSLASFTEKSRLAVGDVSPEGNVAA